MVREALQSRQEKVLSIFGASDRGEVGSINQDYFGIDEPLCLCVVADGMGGHKAGEVASRLGVDAVIGYVRAATGLRSATVHTARTSGPRALAAGGKDHAEGAETPAWPFGYDPSVSRAGNILRTAVHTANTQVFDGAHAADTRTGMGTTIVAGLVHGGKLSIAHVGDSRLYLVARGELRQMTTDDSWVATVLSRNPEADQVALRGHLLRHALTNVLGIRPRTEVHVAEQALDGGELLLLTTDGVHGSLENDRMEHLLGGRSDPAEIAASLIGAALANGSHDNCTAVVARYLPDLPA